MTDLAPDQVTAYLRRIGLDPSDVEAATPDLDMLTTLSGAHVTSVPFENLSIVGDPYGDWRGPGVTLSTPHIFTKVVERRRGGYCFELNGLFHSLLASLDFEVDRVAARMVDNEGNATPPANHHVNVVELDRRYVVDVGMGVPTMRRPTPLDGEHVVDDVGTEWRVAESDRPDETYCTEYRTPTDDEWSLRYVFSDEPRAFHYFEATCDYLQRAPESPFTGDPVVTMATERGHLKLTRGRLTESGSDGKVAEHSLTAEEWYTVLQDRFGLGYDDVLGR